MVKNMTFIFKKETAIHYEKKKNNNGKFKIMILIHTHTIMI